MIMISSMTMATMITTISCCLLSAGSNDSPS
jgi:hypothetical protein